MRVNAPCIKYPANDWLMETVHERLEWARKKAGFRFASAAARSLGVPEQTYLAHENGHRGVPVDAGQHYARRFRVSFGWLMANEGKPSDRDVVPVTNYVGAGQEVFPIDDSAQGYESVDAPPGVVGDVVAARVRGDSMLPQLRDGWLIFWRRDTHEGVPTECINELCVVKVAGEGPTLVKIVRSGGKAGFYRLESHNAEPRDNVKIEWAARVTDIRT